MKIAISDAQGQLSDLVSRAEQGEDVVLTRSGHGVVRLHPLNRGSPLDQRRAAVAAMRAIPLDILPGPCAARSQDFLYDENGLPA
jgi:prevent-host-death family protein